MSLMNRRLFGLGALLGGVFGGGAVRAAVTSVAEPHLWQVAEARRAIDAAYARQGGLLRELEDTGLAGVPDVPPLDLPEHTYHQVDDGFVVVDASESGFDRFVYPVNFTVAGNSREEVAHRLTQTIEQLKVTGNIEHPRVHIYALAPNVDHTVRVHDRVYVGGPYAALVYHAHLPCEPLMQHLSPRHMYVCDPGVSVHSSSFVVTGNTRAETIQRVVDLIRDRSVRLLGPARTFGGSLTQVHVGASFAGNGWHHESPKWIAGPYVIRERASFARDRYVYQGAFGGRMTAEEKAQIRAIFEAADLDPLGAYVNVRA